MNKHLVDLINNWNPAQIFPLIKDEYYPEIKKIQKFIDNSTNLSVDQLAIFIYSTFIHAFGKDVYICGIKECKDIAYKLLKNKEIIKSSQHDKNGLI